MLNEHRGSTSCLFSISSLAPGCDHIVRLMKSKEKLSNKDIIVYIQWMFCENVRSASQFITVNNLLNIQ